MKKTTRDLILYATLIIVGLCAAIWGLAEAQSFLVPITVAALLAMLVLPVCNWLERKGMNRGLASLLSTLAILIFCVALVGGLGLQMRSFASDWPEMREQMIPMVEQLQKEIAERTGLTVQEQNEKVGFDVVSNGSNGVQAENGATAREIDEIAAEGRTDAAAGTEGQEDGNGPRAGPMVKAAGSFLMGFMGFMVSFLLVFIYIFFFLLYRHKFSNTILKMVPDEERPETRRVITNAATISQKYLMGRLVLMVCLTVLYSIGLLISGVEHAIIISVLAAILSLLPFVGNFIGFFIALGMAMLGGADGMMALGILITFVVTQFVETYVLQPYILGDKLNLSPIMVIMVVILGESIWGLAGLAVAIPLLGILKVICDHVPVLEPFGYLLGQEQKKD